MDKDELLTILTTNTTVAVVGASANPDKAAHRIPAMLLRAGYEVIPVNPAATEIWDRPAYPSLADVPVPVDIVDVFRPADEAPAIAEQAVAVGAKVLWLQKDLYSPEAAAIARDAGLTYVEGICIGETRHALHAHPAGWHRS